MVFIAYASSNLLYSQKHVFKKKEIIMKLTTRNLWTMALLMLVTLGLYTIYWLVVTKLELNRAGAQIPSAWLFIIPLVNIYFLFKFAEGFCEVVLKNKEYAVGYFVLILLTFPIAELIYQFKINERQQIPHSSNL